jgi:Protein of unknown function (DUF2934)
MAEFIQRVSQRNSFWRFISGGGFVMAAPKKPKTAGVRTAKSKAAASSGAPKTPLVATTPASNGNGSATPSADMIRLRAYEVFTARAGTAGDELSDWLTAEREIMEKFASHG